MDRNVLLYNTMRDRQSNRPGRPGQTGERLPTARPREDSGSS
jgi:hypothetical protein